jgi:alpha-galactosidase
MAGEMAVAYESHKKRTPLGFREFREPILREERTCCERSGETMSTLISVACADMIAHYERDEATGAVGLVLLPAAGTPGGTPADWRLPKPLESLLQVSLTGDVGHGHRCLGRTLRNSSTTDQLRLAGHRIDEEADELRVTLDFIGPHGLSAVHVLKWQEGEEAVEVTSHVLNSGTAPVILELLASFCLSGITPFDGGGVASELVVHRLRSGWSGEARLVSETIENLHLEPAWREEAANVERFGQVGSMAVRGFAPTVFVEDRAACVTWGAQLHWPGSWQIELYRRGEALSIAGGIGDSDFGHWRKVLAPGESFATPAARISVVKGDVNECIQRLLEVRRGRPVRLPEQSLPVIANEWCTSWGRPNHEELVTIADRLAGSPVKYLVIDAGWYESASGRWSDGHGDWSVDQSLFPNGLAATAQAIRDRGLIPGLWMEIETCGTASRSFSMTDNLLRQNGALITSGGRRFADLRIPRVSDYLLEQTVRLLEQAGIGYLKIDYNESLGIGCDGAESLGEGLRQQMEATLSFFSQLRQRMPQLIMENCASGGHRLEPALMTHFDLGSFSDAMECPELPIIAANAVRLLPARQAVIWVVLRASDTEREQNYKLASGFLGRPCLSGDIVGCSEEQWARTTEALAFYERVRPALVEGRWRRLGPPISSYKRPTGWQAMVREAPGSAGILAIFHAFEGAPSAPVQVELPAEPEWILHTTFGDGELTELGSVLTWQPPGPLSAAVAWLVPAGDSR